MSDSFGNSDSFGLFWTLSDSFQMRLRYRKIYEDYKPRFMWWKLVLLARKLLFAAIVVMVNKDIELQARRLA
jgi:hypothetical protein